MRPQSTALLLLAAPLLLARTAQAQAPIPPSPVPEWEVLGPLKGAGPQAFELAATATAPDRLHANSSAGLLVSFDRGLSWERGTTYDPWASFFLYLTCSQINPDLLLAHDWASGIIRSTDGGLTWNSPSVPPADGFVFDLVMASTADWVYASTASGIWRSLDGGDTFVQVTVEPVAELALDPASENHLYALASDGLRETLDGGASWTTKPYPAGVKTYALVIDPNDGQRLMISAQKSVYLTPDGGDTWVDISPLANHARVLAFDPTDPLRLHLGVSGRGYYYSTDGGLTWTKNLDPGLDYSGGVGFILPSVSHPGELTVAGWGGFFRSTDSGLTFTRSNDGLDAFASVTAIAASPSDPDHLVARTGGSAFYSHDGGATWTESTGMRDFSGDNLVADGVIPDRFYTADVWGGVWRSDDGGHSFYEVYTSFDVSFAKLVAHPTVPERLFVNGSSVWRSDDGGASWTKIAPFGWSWGGLAMSPVDPDVMYSTASGRIYHTQDGGVTWTQEVVPSHTVRAIVADPLDVNRAYAVGLALGSLRTDDGGITWVPTSDQLIDCNTLAFPATDPTTLVFGDWGQRETYFSRDGGDTVRRFPRAPQSQLYCFAPTVNGLFAGTWGGGVLVWR